MINQITINSNNAMEMSRGELLCWVNDMLRVNLSKIQQLGTGAIYCQLLDVIYPGRVAMSKINWKAKFDYEFVNNFKVLQQSFTKLNINKNIDIQKLVKCKYQDNLQFLQWFKKIFDSNGVSGKDYNPIMRRGDGQTQERKKQKQNNRVSLQSSNSKDMFLSNSKTYLEITERSNVSGCNSFQFSDRTDENDAIKLPFSGIKNSNVQNPPNSPANSFNVLDSPWRDQLKQRTFVDERQFYLRKFKEIQHLMEEWNGQRSSEQLIGQVRKIMLVAPSVDWLVQNGEYVEMGKTEQFDLQVETKIHSN